MSVLKIFQRSRLVKIQVPSLRLYIILSACCRFGHKVYALNNLWLGRCHWAVRGMHPIRLCHPQPNLAQDHHLPVQRPASARTVAHLSSCCLKFLHSVIIAASVHVQYSSIGFIHILFSFRETCLSLLLCLINLSKDALHSIREKSIEFHLHQ